MDILSTLVGLISAIVGAIGSWLLSKSSNKAIETLLNDQLQKREADLKTIASEKAVLEQEHQRVYSELEKVANENTKIQEDFGNVRSRLNGLIEYLRESVDFAHIHEVPVMLIGPPGVGKSALLWHWDGSWQKVLEANASIKTSRIFVDSYESNKFHRFADFDDLTVRERDDLFLRVFDCPGDLALQKQVIEKTRELIGEAREKNVRLNLVMVLLIDATGLVDQTSYAETEKWYNDWIWGNHDTPTSAKRFENEIVRELRTQSVQLDELIVVFNKLDKVKNEIANDDHRAEELLKKLKMKFAPCYERILDAANITGKYQLTLLGDDRGLPCEGIGASYIRKLAGKRLVDAFRFPMAPQERRSAISSSQISLQDNKRTS